MLNEYQKQLEMLQQTAEEGETNVVSVEEALNNHLKVFEFAEEVVGCQRIYHGTEEKKSGASCTNSRSYKSTPNKEGRQIKFTNLNKFIPVFVSLMGAPPANVLVGIALHYNYSSCFAISFIAATMWISFIPFSFPNVIVSHMTIYPTSLTELPSHE